jgi:3-phenylpropionate/trans-cinnamate dioxygenase ferredoxin reductase subunit
VARIAKAAGARCYTDPFVQEPRTAEQAGLMSRLTGWLNDPKSETAQPARKPAPVTRGVAAVGVGNR